MALKSLMGGGMSSPSTNILSLFLTLLCRFSPKACIHFGAVQLIITKKKELLFQRLKQKIH